METPLFQLSPVNAEWISQMDEAVDAMSQSYLNEAKKMIHKRYAADADAKDGYSRLAYYIMAKGETLDTALYLFELDAAENRQTWFQQLRHAECVAALGDLNTAFAMVERVYAACSEAVNGYAAIAWRLRHNRDLLPSPWTYAKRDITVRRLSTGYMLNVAELAMMENMVCDAEQLVDQAYKLNPSLTDGYARCAWQHYRPNKEYNNLIEWMGKDYDSGKLSPAWIIKFARTHAAAGNIEVALKLVERAYASDPLLQDGYTQVAHAYCLPRKRYLQMMNLCMADQQQGRLTDKGKFSLAESYMLLGKFDEALPQLCSLETIPKYGWARAIQLWAYFLQWPLSPLLPDDRVLTTLLEKHVESADSNSIGDELICGALADIAVMRERIVAMSSRTGLDLQAQIRKIVASQHLNDPTSESLPFLNAKLYYANASDLFVLFKEIILSESDRFEATSDVPFIIDGGANIGTAIAYFKWLYPQSRIIAFEPNPKLFNICKRNIELNGWSNVTLHQYALAGQCGQMEFHCDKEMPMASSLTNRAEEEGRSFSTVVVEARTLEEFIDRPVDFLKLDIEGVESSVISALGAQLSMVSSGFIEFHHGSSQNSLTVILNMLEKYGHSYIIKEPFHIRHMTGLRQLSPRWSSSVFFKKL